MIMIASVWSLWSFGLFLLPFMYSGFMGLFVYTPRSIGSISWQEVRAQFPLPGALLFSLIIA
jgi:hypothetical protein